MKAKVFSKALLYHLEWKVQLRKFLDGKGNAAVSGTVPTEQSKFGKWLSSDEMSQHASTHEIIEMKRLHTALQEKAKRICELRYLGDTAAARREFKDMEPTSIKLVSLLTTAKNISQN